MRLTWKLALMLAIAVGAQVLLTRYSGDLDEARFAIRVYAAHLCGGTAADADVMDMAVELQNRQVARAQQLATARRAAMQQHQWDAEEIDADEGWGPVNRVNAAAPAR
jgi:hypothetical protein